MFNLTQKVIESLDSTPFCITQHVEWGLVHTQHDF